MTPTNNLATINMEVFQQSKEIVAYLKDAKALPGLVQNEGQLAMVMWSFAEMGVSPAEGISALWSAHAKSRDLPKTMMVIQQGVNCGLRPQESIAGMYPINGTVTTFGSTTNKLIIKAGYRIKIIQYTADACEISVSHNDFGELGAVKFTKEDAMRAKLRGKAGTWTLYPQDMLYWKCVARVLKMYAPDAIGGMQIYEDVKEALDIGGIDLTDDDAIDGFNPSQELPKGAVQIGHVIPKVVVADASGFGGGTATLIDNETGERIQVQPVDEADVVHVDPDAVAEEIAEQQETAETTTAETVVEKENALEKFNKKYGKKKEQQDVVDAVVEEHDDKIDAVIQATMVDNVDDNSDQAIL